jgi:hypothetical protein
MQVADRIFGTEAVRDAPRVAADPDGGLLVVDLKTRARDEVARATVGRTLCSDRVLPVRSARPFAAAVDQRASRGCWVFKLDFLDGNDLVLWEALVGIAYAVDAPPRFHDPSHVLEHLGRSREAVTAAALRHHDALLSRVEFVLQVPRALAIAREEAIVSHLERRRARLAASLLQPLLFGPRRAERETAAQQTVVQEALGRCRERLARLSRQRAVSGTAELAFAVLLR